MKRDDEDRFRVRPGPPRARSGASVRFVSRLKRAAERAGPGAFTHRSPTHAKKAARFGRGHAAARLLARGVDPRARRVVIKARLVNLRRAGVGSIARHLRYIERGGVGPNGEAGRAYTADTDAADLESFKTASRDDRHQFRFIVSPEDAAELGDLRQYTRHLMSQMSRDLGTPLTWVAVDHWDTDDPHTHVVVRGVDADGRDVIIARDYLAHGMRARASELATEWLGPRTEREIRASLDREVTQERWTSLDRQLRRCRAVEGAVHLDALAPADRLRLVGRLQHLARMDLAHVDEHGRWTLRDAHEPTLRTLGERGDILRSMHRALHGSARDLVIHDGAAPSQEISGRIASRGMIDEMGERAYVVIDAVDGRAHYVPLPARVDPGDLPINGIAELGTPTQPLADRNIAARARDGLYRPSQHRASLGSQADADEMVKRHVRRLEALRRADIVERIDADTWRVPSDFMQRARAYELQHNDGLVVTVRSALSIGQQQRAIGATWLDRELLKPTPTAAPLGFGAEVRQALQQRAEFLIEQGLAQRRGQRIMFARDLLKTLHARELSQVTSRLARQLQRAVHVPVEGERVAGIYRRSLMLSSGRFALLDSGASFALVPWRPVMEGHLGQALTGVVRRGSVSWDLQRAPSRGR